MQTPALLLFSRTLNSIFQRRWVRWLAATYISYLALCILVLIPLLNWSAGALYQQETGRTLHYDLIRFNPFTLSITAPNIRDENTEGNTLWSAERIHLNLSLVQSLMNLAPTLDDIDLDGIQIQVHKLVDGRWSFDDIQQHRATIIDAPAQPISDELPALVVQHTRIAINSLQFNDASQPEPFHTEIKKIQFELHDFSTLIDEGQAYHLQATLDESGELTWKGILSVKSGQSEGELAIRNIHLQPVWQYFKSRVNFTLQNSVLNLHGQYRVNWKTEPNWAITQAELELVDNKLRSGKANARNVELSLGELRANGIAASSQTQLVQVDDVQINGLALASWSQGSDSGLTRAFAMDNINSQSATTSDSSEGKPWALQVKSLALNNATIDWRVAELAQHQFAVRHLTIAATNIDTSGKDPLNIQLETTIDQQTLLALKGDFNLHSLDGAFSSNLQALPIAIAQPLLTPYLHADIAAGQLNATTELQVRNAELIQVKTHGELTDIKLHPSAATQELLTWKNLRWSDAHVDLIEQTIDVPLLELSGFDSRFEITADGKTNLQALFPTTVATPDAARNSPQTNAAEPEKNWQFNLQKFVLDKASFRFNDQSLTPNFTAAVQNFNGTMTGLSSDTSKPAVFKFHGDVDGYAPVNLQGKTQPFLEQPLLDAQLDFENLDLGGFSSYSSTYAGWRIERGLLTANLHYRLREGRILGDNHIEMDQLLLGERVENTSAMDIPLRFALALLTDENGLATLDIGVSGNTNEPSFDIGKVIRQAVRNTLVKIVKSPFTLLAKLVGSKEDLGQLPFNSGSSQLLTTATRKLNALQQALNKRPELRIQLRGHYDQNTDRRGLQAAQIKQRLLEQGLNSNDIKTKNEQWEKAVADEYHQRNDKNDQSLSPEQMYEQLLQTVDVTPEALVQLAAQRSVNAKQFLVQQLKVDASRVLINSNLDCNEPGLCSRRIVKLDLSDLNQTAAPTITTPSTNEPTTDTPQPAMP
jgi:hypothetical protein